MRIHGCTTSSTETRRTQSAKAETGDHNWDLAYTKAEHGRHGAAWEVVTNESITLSDMSGFGKDMISVAGEIVALVGMSGRLWRGVGMISAARCLGRTFETTVAGQATAIPIV